VRELSSGRIAIRPYICMLSYSGLTVESNPIAIKTTFDIIASLEEGEILWKRKN
jgi:hypothetical protein